MIMLFNAAKMEINLSDFELVPEARSHNSFCAINFSPSGNVSLNQKFMGKIVQTQEKEAIKVEFRLHKSDKRILLLSPSDTPNYSFSSQGIRKDKSLTQTLIDSGITLPARYEVEWNEAASVWIGVLQKELVPNALQRTLNQTQKTKRGRKNEIC